MRPRDRRTGDQQSGADIRNSVDRFMTSLYQRRRNPETPLSALEDAA